MQYSFTAFGHKNITAKHKRTLEFTKDSELGIEGDCILGVSSNFNLYDLKEIIKGSKKLKMTITVDNIEDEIIFEPNKEFNDEKELVIRKGNFISERTFGINADKSCSDLKKALIHKLKNPDQKINISIAYAQSSCLRDKIKNSSLFCLA